MRKKEASKIDKKKGGEMIQSTVYMEYRQKRWRESRDKRLRL